MFVDTTEDLPELTPREIEIVEEFAADLIQRSIHVTYPSAHPEQEIDTETIAKLTESLRNICYCNARLAKARGEILTCEDNTGTDPFYSESNMEHLRRGAAALDAGQGQEHELIKDEKEKVTGN